MASCDTKLFTRCGATLHLLAVDGGPYADVRNAAARGPSGPAGNLAVGISYSLLPKQ